MKTWINSKHNHCEAQLDHPCCTNRGFGWKCCQFSGEKYYQRLKSRLGNPPETFTQHDLALMQFVKTWRDHGGLTLTPVALYFFSLLTFHFSSLPHSTQSLYITSLGLTLSWEDTEIRRLVLLGASILFFPSHLSLMPEFYCSWFFIFFGEGGGPTSPYGTSKWP